jgi:hypothetical protein
MKLLLALLALPLSALALEPAVQDLAKVLEADVSCKVSHPNGIPGPGYKQLGGEFKESKKEIVLSLGKFEIMSAKADTGMLQIGLKVESEEQYKALAESDKEFKHYKENLNFSLEKMIERQKEHPHAIDYNVTAILTKSGVEVHIKKGVNIFSNMIGFTPNNSNVTIEFSVPLNKKTKVGDLEVLCEKKDPPKELSRKEQRRINRDGRNSGKDVPDPGSSSAKKQGSGKQ